MTFEVLQNVFAGMTVEEISDVADKGEDESIQRRKTLLRHPGRIPAKRGKARNPGKEHFSSNCVGTLSRYVGTGGVIGKEFFRYLLPRCRCAK